MKWVEQAIKKAIDGGYRSDCRLYEINEESLILVRFIKHNSHRPWSYQTPLASILLDPWFWQSLIDEYSPAGDYLSQLIVQLYKLNTLTAARLLERINMASVNEFITGYARAFLLEMHRDGNPLLRAEIERFFVLAEGTFTQLESVQINGWDEGGIDKP